MEQIEFLWFDDINSCQIKQGMILSLLNKLNILQGGSYVVLHVS